MPVPLCSDPVKETISLIGIMSVALGVTCLTWYFDSTVFWMICFLPWGTAQWDSQGLGRSFPLNWCPGHHAGFTVQYQATFWVAGCPCY